jgi:hypothetical protein
MNNTLPNSFTLNIYNTDPDVTRDVSLFELGGTSGIPSDIVITEKGSANYSSILNSQNGGVWLIEGLTIQINQYATQEGRESQMLKPFRFKKLDVNGNEYEIQKVQVIDPYQYQLAYRWVDLTDDGEVYALDGNTAFRYTIEPLTGVDITFNYVESKIKNFGSEEGQKISEQEFNKIHQLESNSEFATESELDVQDNAKVTNKKKKPSNWLYWLIGASAVYLLFNPFKTNQK